MTRNLATILLTVLAVGGCAPAEADPPVQDPALLEGILEDVRVGWEQGDGAPFYAHFLDWEGARYFEGGGQNVGLRDLVENHVEPEAELGLRLEFSDIQTHFEGDFAWATRRSGSPPRTGAISTTGATEPTSSGGSTAPGRWCTHSRGAPRCSPRSPARVEDRGLR